MKITFYSINADYFFIKLIFLSLIQASFYQLAPTHLKIAVHGKKREKPSSLGFSSVKNELLAHTSADKPHNSTVKN